MIVDRIQTPSWERRSTDVAGQQPAPARSKWYLEPDTTGQDQVVVSDRARQLAADPTVEQDAHLQLDFKKLRELAFPKTPPSTAPTDSAE